MITFVTYFDGNFLLRGLALIESLRATLSVPWCVRVLCLDEGCRDALEVYRRDAGLPAEQLELWSLAELEAAYPELADLRRSRGRIEYYFSLTPYLCAWALDREAEGGKVVYLDADLYFFSDPRPLLAAMGNAPVSVVEHRYSPGLAQLTNVYGRFNVGWIGFTRSEAARSCVDWWQERCREWCRDVPENGRFADQHYLDEWPERVPGLVILDHPGANLAPWNIRTHRIERSDSDGLVLADGRPLIFFHFHRLRRLQPGLYETDYGGFGRLHPVVRDAIYRPYLAALGRLERRYGTNGETSGGLERFDRPRALTPKALFLAATGIARLFTRQRVVFHDGEALTPWKGIIHV